MSNDPQSTSQGRGEQSSRENKHEYESPPTRRTDTTSATMRNKPGPGQHKDQSQGPTGQRSSTPGRSDDSDDGCGCSGDPESRAADRSSGQDDKNRKKTDEPARGIPNAASTGAARAGDQDRGRKS